MINAIAPGARILCRDAEWLVKSTAHSSDGDRVIENPDITESTHDDLTPVVEGTLLSLFPSTYK